MNFDDLAKVNIWNQTGKIRAKNLAQTPRAISQMPTTNKT